MKLFTTINHPDITALLRSGGVGILRTDTLYGIVARADSEEAVERVYRLKDRNTAKSPIVLIGSMNQLFDKPDQATSKLIDSKWPGKVSIIIPSTNAPTWLTRGNKSVAYRLPADDDLRGLLDQTGALIAPSANPEGEDPAMTIEEAREYFGDRVDFYVDGGRVADNKPSQLLRLTDSGELEQLR